MILLLADTEAELDAVVRAVAQARHRHPGAPLDDTRALFIGRQPSATVVELLALARVPAETALMTRRETARLLCRSTATVDRLAAAGRLVKLDGRIVRSSVDEYLRGER